jgi:membrane protease YdiL (CAAX protease family)
MPLQYALARPGLTHTARAVLFQQFPWATIGVRRMPPRTTRSDKSISPAPSPADGRWPENGYWHASRQPLASLLFVTPLLIVYELGVLIAGPQALRNGADAWLRQWLDLLGFGNYFLLPALTVGILLGWHHLTGRPWRVAPRTLWGMAAESGLLAAALLLIARLHAVWFARLALAQAGWPPAAEMVAQVPFPLADAAAALSPWERLTLYLGAGIYEELLFRLILLSLVAAAARAAGAPPGWSFLAAIVLTSLAFSAAHYVGPHGDALGLSSFVFRFVAGVFFALLFVFRGFGIAAGAHAGYDILVGL